MSSNIERQTYENYTRLLTRDYERWKIWDRFHTGPMGTQMPTLAAKRSKTLNHHRWRNQDIPWKKNKFTQYLSTNPVQNV